jgi:asparagine synthase (glutamine-hydrolysing)
MPAAGFLRVVLDDPASFRRAPASLDVLNVDCEDPSKTLAQHADEFVDLMVATCRTYGRGNLPGTQIVSLSGGYDSRVVAAAYQTAGIDLVATTFRNTALQRARESETARRIASALDLPWHCVDVTQEGADAMEELVALKDGLNAIDNAYILDYLRVLVDRWGRGATYITGDGGGYVFKTTAPAAELDSVDAVVEWISREWSFTPLDTAAALLHVHRDDLLHELHRLVASFPEARLAKRAMHFRILERGRKMNFEGEDRTKFFLWQTAPLYARSVFLHCLRVPDRLKTWNRWVGAVVRRVSPALARIPVEPLGIAPASPLHSLAYRTRELVERLPTPVRNATRSVVRRWGAERAGTLRPLGRTASDDPVRAHFRTHLEPEHPMWNAIDRDRTASLLATGTWAQIIPLATLLLLAKRELDGHAGDRVAREASR